MPVEYFLCLLRWCSGLAHVLVRCCACLTNSTQEFLQHGGIASRFNVHWVHTTSPHSGFCKRVAGTVSLPFFVFFRFLLVLFPLFIFFCFLPSVPILSFFQFLPFLSFFLFLFFRFFPFLLFLSGSDFSVFFVVFFLFFLRFFPFLFHFQTRMGRQRSRDPYAKPRHMLPSSHQHDNEE